MLEKYIKKLENEKKRLKNIKDMAKHYHINSLRSAYMICNEYIEDITKTSYVPVTNIEFHLKCCKNLRKQIKFDYENGGDL